MVKSLTINCIVLKHFDLGEADRVLTVFSREMGKVSVLVKGVRRIVSKKAGSVEIGNNCRMLVYEGKNFWLLQEVSLLHAFLTVKANLGMVKYGYYVLELVDSLTETNQSHPEVYNFLVWILQLLQKNPRKLFIRAFEVKILHSLGFLTVHGINLHAGSIAGSEFLDDESLDLLIQLQSDSWEQISDFSMNEDVALRLEQFLRFRIEHVTEKPLKSLAFFE